MICDQTFQGKYVSLRSVTMEDAQYTLDIRQDISKTKFLNRVPNDLEAQRRWIAAQMERTGDYFFLVSSKKGRNVGTVGLYDINEKKGHLGRLLMFGSPFLSFEACMLVCDYGFNVLGLDEIFGDVTEGNDASLGFSKALGMKFDTDTVFEGNRRVCYGIIAKKEYPHYRNQLEKLIYR